MQVLPDEWEYAFYQGKLAAKLGYAPANVLHLMAQACHKADTHEGGLTEPLYRLHATRLKLLLGPNPPLGAIAGYPFLPETSSHLQGEQHLGQLACAIAFCLCLNRFSAALKFKIFC